jgi:Ku protein
MARAIWTGSLSFGLVNIPVEVHTAVRETRPHFRMLHAKDKSPINFQRICQKDGQEVAWDDLVRGYEYERGHFVVLTKEDLAAAALEKTRRIDILDFVEGDTIDDRYFDKPYYLTPGKGGDMAYALLREAIRESKRIGIAKFIMREVQHLCAVEVVGDALVLSTLRFADELVDDAGREPRRRVETGEVHRRLSRESDESDQGEDERQGGASRARDTTTKPEGDRLDGAAAGQSRRRAAEKGGVVRQTPQGSVVQAQERHAPAPRRLTAPGPSPVQVSVDAIGNRGQSKAALGRVMKISPMIALRHE